MSKIILDDELDRRIGFAQLKGNETLDEDDFRLLLFMKGLLDYERRVIPKITGKPYKAYYSIRGEEVIDPFGNVMPG